MYGFIITTAGEGLLARASAGEALTITEVWVGKGTVESAAAAKALTALLDPVAQATSTQPEVAGGQLSMLVEYRNDMGGGLGGPLSSSASPAQSGRRRARCSTPPWATRPSRCRPSPRAWTYTASPWPSASPERWRSRWSIRRASG